MLRPIDILINSFAQDKLGLEKLLIWFDTLAIIDKRKAVYWSRILLEQSRPDNELIESGIKQIPLKSTFTPIVLLNTKSFKIALTKIVELPDAEMKKAFITLISLFKVSDEKEERNGVREYVAMNGMTLIS